MLPVNVIFIISAAAAAVKSLVCKSHSVRIPIDGSPHSVVCPEESTFMSILSLLSCAVLIVFTFVTPRTAAHEVTSCKSRVMVIQ